MGNTPSGELSQAAVRGLGGAHVELLAQLDFWSVAPGLPEQTGKSKKQASGVFLIVTDEWVSGPLVSVRKHCGCRAPPLGWRKPRSAVRSSTGEWG